MPGDKAAFFKDLFRGDVIRGTSTHRHQIILQAVAFLKVHYRPGMALTSLLRMNPHTDIIEVLVLYNMKDIATTDQLFAQIK